MVDAVAVAAEIKRFAPAGANRLISAATATASTIGLPLYYVIFFG